MDAARVVRRVRATTLCDPRRFFTSLDAASDWQARNAGMLVATVTDAYRHQALPVAHAILNQPAADT